MCSIKENTCIWSSNKSKPNYFQIEFKGRNIFWGVIIATGIIKWKLITTCRCNGTGQKMHHSINCKTHFRVCKCHFAHTSKHLVVNLILPENDV